MFLGYLSFAGTEIWNSTRAVRYAREIVPGIDVSDCNDCADLAEVLGDKAYTTPFVDQAPWFDPSDPHTWDFAGVIPLSAEGVEDSTVAAETTDLVGGGGYVQAPVAKAREMRFTGLLLGADEAAVESGMTWLKAALETNPCSATPGCTGDHLCYLSACPEICEDSPDLPPEYTRRNLARNPRGRGDPGTSFHGGGSLGWPAGYVQPGEATARGFSRENLVAYPAGTALAPGAWSYAAQAGLVRENLHPDPRCLTMRVGTVPGGVAITPTTEGTGAPDGREMRRFTFNTGLTTGTGYVGNRTDAVEQIPVTVGDTVTWAVWVRASAPTIVRPEIVWHSSGSVLAPNSTTLGSNVTLVANTWTRLTLTAPVNPEAGNGAGRVAFAATASTPIVVGTTLDVAQRLFEVADEARPYFDGDTPDTMQVVYDWTGEADNSTSTATPVDATVVELVTNGPGPQVTDTRTLTTYVQATASANPLGGFSVPIVRTLVAAGQTVTASMWVRRRDGGPVALTVTEGDVFTTGETVDAGGGWVRVSVTHLVETGDTPLVMTGQFTDIGDGEILAATGALAELGDVLGEYFDGDTMNVAGEREYAWTGAANASTSYEQVVIADSPAGVGFQWAWATADATGDVDANAAGEFALIERIKAAQVYGARAWVYTPADMPAGLQVGLHGVWCDQYGRPLEGEPEFWFDATPPPPVAGWAEYVGQSPPAPIGAVTMLVTPAWHGYTPGATQVPRGTTLAWAALLVEEGRDAPGEYFDGDFADTSLMDYEWAGEPDQAVSVAEPRLVRTCPTGTPAVGVETCMFDYLRHMRVVTTTSGPTITQKYSPSCGAMWQVEWTMVAGVPHAYTSNYFIGSTTCPTDECVVVNEVECVPVAAATITDPDCPPLPSPPRPPDIPIDCLEFPDQWCRFAIPIPKDLVPTWSTGIPYIQLRTGNQAVRQLRLRFYSNPFNRELDMLDGCDYCGEFFVSYIPPNSIMSLDGVEEQVTVEQPGGRISTGNHLLYGSDGGPMSWPELICGIPFTAVVDVAPALEADILVTLCVAYRS